MQSTYAASIMRDRRRSIISFRRTNFPSDITAFARLTFLLPSFFFFLLFLFRRPRGNGRRKKRENSAIFHNDIARREFNSPLIIIIITAKHEIFRYPPLLTFTFLFETCVFYLYFFSTERRTKLENFHRECSSAGRVERRRNRRETASSVQMHCVCGYIVLVRARFRFCPSVRSCLAVIRFRVKLLTESRRGEKKKDTSVPCEIKPYIYDWGASCAPVREPSSIGGGGY